MILRSFVKINLLFHIMDPLKRKSSAPAELLRSASGRIIIKIDRSEYNIVWLKLNFQFHILFTKLYFKSPF